jgi:hypothetical protein
MSTEPDDRTDITDDIDNALARIEAIDRPDGAAGTDADGQGPSEVEASDEASADVVDSAAEGDAADEAPSFWSAADRHLWSEVPAALRPVLHRYERQRVAHVNEKSEQAARERAEAARAAQAAGRMVEQAAAWWQQNGPAVHKAVAEKWSEIDWKELAEKNPEEVARLIKQRQDEQAVLAEAERRGQAEIAAARERADQALREARLAEHATLAARLPEFFGPERARQTYDELARFLLSKGIPADRIASVFEAPVIEIALSAMRFDKAQRALHSRAGGEGGQPHRNPAVPTPTRIAPGPAARPGNRNADAVRQVGERFRQSGGASIADAAELIRLSGL